jgi:hypothetical protein
VVAIGLTLQSSQGDSGLAGGCWFRLKFGQAQSNCSTPREDPDIAAVTSNSRIRRAISQCRVNSLLRRPFLRSPNRSPMNLHRDFNHLPIRRNRDKDDARRSLRLTSQRQSVRGYLAGQPIRRPRNAPHIPITFRQIFEPEGWIHKHSRRETLPAAPKVTG